MILDIVEGDSIESVNNILDLNVVFYEALAVYLIVNIDVSQEVEW